MFKLELDVFKIDEIQEATNFASKHRLPAIVTSPELFSHAALIKGKTRSQHKIIVAVDWLKGKYFGIEKFRDIPTTAMNADGFEILLTNKTSKSDIRQELNYIDNLFDNYFPSVIEKRYVLGWQMPDRDEEYFKNVISCMSGGKTPFVIRTTPLTKIPVSASKSHDSIIDIIRHTKNMPIKMSGSMTPQLRWHYRDSIKRFACTLEQAKKIAKEINDNTLDQVKNVIDTDKKNKAV